MLFTLTPYGADLEPGVPGKEAVLDSFFRLSDRLGPERVSWRYDPVVIADGMDESWHLSRFGELARRLEGRTERCIASLVSPYSSIKKNLVRIGWQDPDPVRRRRLFEGLSGLAEAHGMKFQTCAEEPTGPQEPEALEFRDLRGALPGPGSSFPDRGQGTRAVPRPLPEEALPLREKRGHRRLRLLQGRLRLLLRWRGPDDEGFTRSQKIS